MKTNIDVLFSNENFQVTLQNMAQDEKKNNNANRECIIEQWDF